MRICHIAITTDRSPWYAYTFYPEKVIRRLIQFFSEFKALRSQVILDPIHASLSTGCLQRSILPLVARIVNLPILPILHLC